MAQEHKKVNQHLIGIAFDFEILEEHVDPEVGKCLIDNVHVAELVVDIGRAVDFGLEGHYGQPACCSYTGVLVVDRVLCLP